MSDPRIDYSVRVHIIEARDLKARDSNGTSDPVVFVRAFAQTQHTSVFKKTLSCTFDENLVFRHSCTRASLEKEVIKLSVYDANTFTRNTIIGIYDLDARYVLQQPGNRINSWVALFNPKNTSSGIQGYLKVAVYIDEGIVATDDDPLERRKPLEVRDYDDDSESDLERERSGGLSLLLPPTIKAEQNTLVFTVYRAEHMPKMDTLRSCDPYVKVWLGSRSAKTTCKRGTYEPIWNEQLSVPFMMPTMLDNVRMTVKDWNPASKNEVIGVHKLSLKSIMQNPLRATWVNLYGSRQHDFSKSAELMNAGRLPPNGYRGRVLVAARVEKGPPTAAKMVMQTSPCPLPPARPYILRVDLFDACSLNCHIGAIARVRVSMGGSKVAKSKYAPVTRGFSTWYETLEDIPLSLPTRHEEVPDIFVSVVCRTGILGKTGAGLSTMVGFLRLKHGIDFDLNLDSDASNRAAQAVLQRERQPSMSSDGGSTGPLVDQRGMRMTSRRHTTFGGEHVLETAVVTGRSHDESPLIPKKKKKMSIFRKKKKPKEESRIVAMPQWCTLRADPLSRAARAEIVPGFLLLNLQIAPMEEMRACPRNVLGKVTMLHYVLVARIYQGFNLRVGDRLNSLSDPYCRVQLANACGQTATKQCTLNPNWYETIVLHVDLPDTIELAPDIIIQVFDRDALSETSFISDDFLGRFVVPIREVAAHTSKHRTPTSSFDPSMASSMPVGSLGTSAPTSHLQTSTPHDGNGSYAPPSSCPKGAPMSGIPTLKLPTPPMSADGSDLSKSPVDGKMEPPRSSTNRPIGGFDDLFDNTFATPKLYDLYLTDPENTKGSVLASFDLIPDPLHVIPKEVSLPPIIPEAYEAMLEIFLIGARDLRPFGIKPITKPYVEVEYPRNLTHAETVQSGRSDIPFPENPNFLEMIRVPVTIPVDPTYHAVLDLRLYDHRYKGLLKPLLGRTHVDLRSFLPKEADRDCGPGHRFSLSRPFNPNRSSLASSRSSRSDSRPLSFHDTSKTLMGLEDDVEHSGALGVSDDDRDVYDGELENTTHPCFSTFPLRREAIISQDGLEVGVPTLVGEYLDSLLQNSTSFLGSVVNDILHMPSNTVTGRVRATLNITPVDAPFSLTKHTEKFQPRPVVVRFYVLRAQHLAAMDLNGKADPYIYISSGTRVFADDRANCKFETLNPDIYTCFEVRTTLPGCGIIDVSVYDYDALKIDDLIGTTQIDLESRWFCEEWRNLPKKPIERRPLYNPSSTTPQGVLELWIDIYTEEEALRIPVTPIAAPVMLKCQLRVVVWDAEVELERKKGTKKKKKVKPVDLMVAGILSVGQTASGDGGVCEQRKETDVHHRVDKGKAEFNWRLLYNIELPARYPRFRLQLHDYNMTSRSEALGEVAFSLKPLCKKVRKSGKGSRLKKQWVNLEHPDWKGARGRVRIQVSLLPEREALETPAGPGREEPNQDPELPMPDRPDYSFAPWRVDKWLKLKGKQWLRKAKLVACAMVLLAILAAAAFLTLMKYKPF